MSGVWHSVDITHIHVSREGCIRILFHIRLLLSRIRIDDDEHIMARQALFL